MIRFTTTNVYHVTELLDNLRPDDRAEVEAARGTVTPMQLWADVKVAQHCITALDSHNRVVCVYGLSRHPAQAEVGVVWLLGTALLDKHMFQLCKEARTVLASWHKKFPILTNFTDKRNTRVLRWLRWLGFTFGSTIDVRGHTFIQFTSNRHV